MFLGVAALLLLTTPALAVAASSLVMPMDGCAHHVPVKTPLPDMPALCFACSVNCAPMPTEAFQLSPPCDGGAVDIQLIWTDLRVGIDHAPNLPPPR